MAGIGTGTIGGQYAGVSEFKGETDVELLLVHLDTFEGKAILLTKKSVWDENYDHLELGQNVVVQFSVIEGNDGDEIYVLERIVGLK
jgi:hypothetical protein